MDLIIYGLDALTSLPMSRCEINLTLFLLLILDISTEASGQAKSNDNHGFMEVPETVAGKRPGCLEFSASNGGRRCGATARGCNAAKTWLEGLTPPPIAPSDWLCLMPTASSS